MFTDHLLEATGAENVHAAMHLFYTPAWPRSRVAELARQMDRAAGAGDAVALEILREAARKLAVLTHSVRSQLWKRGEPVRTAYVGGVFRSVGLLAYYRMLVAAEDGVEPAPPIYGPAAGALLEAYRAAGLRPRLEGLPEFKT